MASTFSADAALSIIQDIFNPQVPCPSRVNRIKNDTSWIQTISLSAHPNLKTNALQALMAVGVRTDVKRRSAAVFRCEQPRRLR